MSSARSFSSSSRLCSRSSRCVFRSVEPLLLGLVLLARERVDLPERAAARLEPLDARREARRGRRPRPARRHRRPRAAASRRATSASMRAISTSAAVSRRARLLELAAEIHLGRAERAQLLAELARPQRARVDARAERRLEARRRPGARRRCRRGAPVASSTSRPSVRASTDAARSLGAARTPPRRRARAPLPPPQLRSRPRPRSSSAAASAASAARRPWSSSRTASAVSPDEPELAARRVVAEAFRRDGRRA